MASVSAVRPQGQCSSTDPASLPTELFLRVLGTVYLSGDVAWETKSKRSYEADGTNFTPALVSKQWHRASMRALTVARVTAEDEGEAKLLQQLSRFKALTKIVLHERAVTSLSAMFLQAASRIWPRLVTLVLRDTITEFPLDGPSPPGAHLPSLTSVVIRSSGDLFTSEQDPVTRWLPSVAGLSNLELLEAYIDRLPEDFGARFPKLRRLWLSNIGNLESLPESLGDIAGLEELVLDTCSVPALPHSLTRLSSFKKLMWNNPDIRDLRVVSCLTGLRHLNLLTDTVEGKAPAGMFAGLKRLRVFKLRTSVTGDVAASPLLQGLVHCTGLRMLHLSGCHGLLGDLAWLPQLTALRKLEVCSHEMADLPANIGALQRLERACFRGGCYKTLPRSFGDLTSLRYLRVEGSALEELPNSLSCLTQLTQLWLSGSAKLTAGTMNLGGISSLQTFSVSGCSLPRIPEDLGLLPNLTSLRIRCKPSNSLLPRGFPRLQELEIHEPLWPEAPELVGSAEAAQLTAEDYPCLKLLKFTGWEAETLPSAVGQLQHLERLEIGMGEFTQLPESLSSLRSLKELHLHGCRKLLGVPATLGVISSFTKLCMHDCDSVDRSSLTDRLKEVEEPCGNYPDYL